MALRKNILIECDVCGFEYRRNVMKKNSYGMLVCPEDYEGIYDSKSHPQNTCGKTSKTNLGKIVYSQFTSLLPLLKIL